MSAYILTHRTLSVSARALASELSDRFSRTIRVEYGDNRPTFAPFLRWGNSSFDFPSGDTPFNDPNLIRISGNKKLFADKMVELEIPAISFHKGVPDHFPIAIRKTLSGRGGEGIVICKDYDEWTNYSQYFWSYWYKFPYELGVHIVDGKVLKVFKKVRADGGEQEEEFPIRNMVRGYKFALVKEESFPKLVQFNAEFSNKFKMGFGRMDIGWDAEGKMYRIIEWNCAPGIASNYHTLDAYASALYTAIKSRMK
jgi:hypothetical protein